MKNLEELFVVETV